MLHWSLRLLVSLCIVPAALWALLAMHYQLPFSMLQNGFMMLCWLGLSLYVLVLLWRGHWKTAVVLYLALHAEVLLWWGQLEPRNDREWADEVAQVTTGHIRDDVVTLSNVRNFRWRSESDYEVRWDTRRYDLNQLTSVDLITSHWGLQSIAHVMLSFGFGNGDFVTFSVEIRKEKFESFSSIGGFFKQFELSILATDERDAIGVRPNHRGEDTYLYRIAMPARLRKALFLAYVEEANALARTPRFYHTVTSSCTTLVYRMMQQVAGGFPLDSRLLLTGYLPGYVAEQDGLIRGFELNQLRQLGHINQRSRDAGNAADYSRQIRRGVPGWLHMPERPLAQGLPF